MHAIEIALETLADWAAARPAADRRTVSRALRRALIRLEGEAELRALESASVQLGFAQEHLEFLAERFIARPPG